MRKELKRNMARTATHTKSSWLSERTEAALELVKHLVLTKDTLLTDIKYNGEEIRRGDADDHILLGVVLAEKDRPFEAAIQFMIAVDCQPDNPHARKYLQRMLIVYGGVNAVIRAYKAGEWKRLGQLIAKQHLDRKLTWAAKIEDAAQTWRAAIAVDASDLSLCARFCRTLAETLELYSDRPDETAYAYVLAIRLAPKEHIPRIKYGQYLLGIGRYIEAEKILQPYDEIYLNYSIDDWQEITKGRAEYCQRLDKTSEYALLWVCAGTYLELAELFQNHRDKATEKELAIKIAIQLDPSVTKSPRYARLSFPNIESTTRSMSYQKTATHDPKYVESNAALDQLHTQEQLPHEGENMEEDQAIDPNSYGFTEEQKAFFLNVLPAVAEAIKKGKNVQARLDAKPAGRPNRAREDFEKLRTIKFSKMTVLPVELFDRAQRLVSADRALRKMGASKESLGDRTEVCAARRHVTRIERMRRRLALIAGR